MKYQELELSVSVCVPRPQGLSEARNPEKVSGALEVSEGGRSGGGTVLRGLCFSVGSQFWGPVVEALKLGSGHLSRKRRRQQLGLRELRERPNCGGGGGNPEDADGRAAQ